MENIHITSSPTTPYFPEVDFNAQTGVCELRGESYMEETYKFYLPLLNWLKDYTTKADNKVELNVKLIYLNTTSTKCILDMLEILKTFENNGGKVKVNWFYDKNDPDMVDEVEDFEAESGIKIELHEFVN